MEYAMSNLEANVPIQDDNVPIQDGYPRLAQAMGDAPSIAMLVVLEKELRELQQKDKSGAGNEPRPNTRCSRDWRWLGVYKPECDQWKKVVEIRKVLKEYNKAILRQVQMNSLEAPPRYDLDDIQTRFRNSADETSDSIGLRSKDGLVWGSKIPHEETVEAKDLVALSPRPESDPFSTLIMEKCTPWLYQHLREINETVFVNDQTQLRYTAMLTTIVASLLPIASIAVLYSSKSTKVRLGLIGIFTFIFASSLVCFTTAKRTDVFSATAAFAAVQVVFIGTNGP